MGVFIVDEYLFVLQIVNSFIIDVVYRVGVVQGIWRGFLPWREAEHSPHVAGVTTALLGLDVPDDVLLPPEVADVPSLAPSQGGQEGAEDVPDHGGGVF